MNKKHTEFWVGFLVFFFFFFGGGLPWETGSDLYTSVINGERKCQQPFGPTYKNRPYSVFIASTCQNFLENEDALRFLLQDERYGAAIRLRSLLTVNGAYKRFAKR